MTFEYIGKLQKYPLSRRFEYVLAGNAGLCLSKDASIVLDWFTD